MKEILFQWLDRHDLTTEEINDSDYLDSLIINFEENICEEFSKDDVIYFITEYQKLKLTIGPGAMNSPGKESVVVDNLEKVTINIPLDTTNLNATEVYEKLINNSNFDVKKFTIKNGTHRDTRSAIFVAEISVIQNKFDTILEDVQSDYILVVESEEGSYTLFANKNKETPASDYDVNKFYYLLD